MEFKASDHKPRLLIHGGAGSRGKDFPEEEQLRYLTALEIVLLQSYELLKAGRSALDIVEFAVKLLEDKPLFNAGKGSVFNEHGYVELEASIMDGSNMNAGACTLVKHLKNPISLARLVKEKTSHVLLAAPRAEELAKEHGLDMVDNCYFYTKKRWDQHRKGRDNVPERPPVCPKDYDTDFQYSSAEGPKGTVGAVCLDVYGNLAAATSTGGRTNKMAQRIGDTPIIGAGNYAENESCAVSGTGHGDYFLRHCVAYDIAARIKYGNATVKDAAKSSLEVMAKHGGDGGVIVIDKNGNFALEFNTTLMFRGSIGLDGKPEAKIF